MFSFENKALCKKKKKEKKKETEPGWLCFVDIISKKGFFQKGFRRYKMIIGEKISKNSNLMIFGVQNSTNVLPHHKELKNPF